MKNRKELNMRLQRTDNLNKIYFDDIMGPGNGRYRYEVERDGITLAKIQFQDGVMNERGTTDGVRDNDLLEIVRHRLQCFQLGAYATRENARALEHIEEALMWLAKSADDLRVRSVLDNNLS